MPVTVIVRAGVKKGDNQVRNTVNYIDENTGKVVYTYTTTGTKNSSLYPGNSHPGESFTHRYPESDDLTHALALLGWLVDQDNPANQVDADLITFGDHDQTYTIFVKSVSDSPTKAVLVGPEFSVPEMTRSWDFSNGTPAAENYIANFSQLPQDTTAKWVVEPQYDWTKADGMYEDPDITNPDDSLPSIEVDIPGQAPQILTFTTDNKYVLSLPEENADQPVFKRLQYYVGQTVPDSPKQYLSNYEDMLKAAKINGHTQQEFDSEIYWVVKPSTNQTGYTVATAAVNGEVCSLIAYVSPAQKSDLASRTRTIEFINPDTGQAFKTESQDVYFERTGQQHLTDQQSPTWGEWEYSDPLNTSWSAITQAPALPVSVKDHDQYVADLSQVDHDVPVYFSTPPQTVQVYYHKVAPAEGQVLITYVEKANPDHILGTTSVTGATGSTVPVASVINRHVPAKWQIDPSFNVPASETVPGAVTVPLIHATTPVIPGQPGVTPDNPDYDQLFHQVTRTINVENPVTNHTDVTKESVMFGRTGVMDEVTGKLIDGQYGDWYVYNPATNQLTTGQTGQWNQFDAPEFTGFTPSQAVVEAKTVTAATPDETVTITYTKDAHGHQENNDHGQPTPGNHTGNPVDYHSNIDGGVTNINHHVAINTTSQDKSQALPQTGNAISSSALVGMGLASLMAALGLGAKKKHTDK